MRESNRELLLVALGCGALAVLAYAWSLGGQFLNWDDPKYVFENPELRDASPAGIASIFSSFHFANYNPLHRLSYLVEWQIFGANATAFRVTNVALHALNAVLLFALIRVWVQDLWVAVGAAALFLVHPANVETVAWISSRKSLLATMFAFASVLFWLRSSSDTVGSARPRRDMVVALCCFALGLLCKTSIVVLPVLLVGFDLVARRDPRNRWTWYAAFFGLAIVMGIVQIAAASADSAVRPLHGGGVVSHVATIIAVLPCYLFNLVWPFGLTPRHEFAPATLWDPRFWVGIGLLGMVAWGLVRSWRAERRFAMAVLWCLATLSVTLIVPIPILLADRYWYFAMPLLLAVFVQSVTRVRSVQPEHVRIAVGAMVVVLSVATVDYSRVWRDSGGLWSRAIEHNPSDAEAWVSLAAVHVKTGELSIATRAYEQALQVSPGYPEAIENLANVEMQTGKVDSARRRLEQLLLAQPERGQARAMYAVTLDLGGDVEGARREFLKGLEADATSVPLLMNFVNFCQRHGRRGDGREVLGALVAAHPESVSARRALASLEALPASGSPGR